jgi:hypothetical protein
MLTIESKKIREEILSRVPSYNSWDSCAGGGSDEFTVTAIGESGNKYVLDSEGTQGYANQHTPNITTKASPIREQIAMLPGIIGLEVLVAEDYSYRDVDGEYDYSIEDFKEGIPPVGNGDSLQFYIPLQPVDWETVRRRLEDRLRKDEAAMKRAAAVLDIKIY